MARSVQEADLAARLCTQLALVGRVPYLRARRPGGAPESAGPCMFEGRRGTPSLSTTTLYAPMACVMPPASSAATAAARMRSSSDVLPWSTWPMTHTTGGRVTRYSRSSSVTNSSRSDAAATCTDPSRLSMRKAGVRRQTRRHLSPERTRCAERRQTRT